MNWPVADPDSKQACGHQRCLRSTQVTVWLLTAAGVLVGAGGAYGCCYPGSAPSRIAVVAGVLAGICGLAAACWPHPRTDDLEALVEATREELHPDFTEWEKELNSR